jgi:hypothetical protein
MSNIFNNDISNIELKNELTIFLNKFCIIENDIYTINKEIAKKYDYNNEIDVFFDNMKKYYRGSKKYFLLREYNYNNLLTILRQICNFLNIKYTKKIIYNKSTYNIIYQFTLN